MEKQKGSLPIIIAVIAVVIAGGVGYFTINKNKPAGNSPLQKIVNLKGNLNSNCKYNDPELCKYINKSLTFEGYKNGFTGKTIMTDKSGKKNESVFKFQNDRSHFLTKDNSKEIMESITINKTTYTKDYTDNKWWKYSPEESKTSNVKTSGSNLEEMKKEVEKNFNEDSDKTTYKKIGEETCGKLQCFKYQVMSDLTSNSKEYLYFDNQEYLLRKMKIEDNEGSITETEYEFGNVKINEPAAASVKEMTTGQNPYLPGGSKIDQKELENIQKELEKNE